MTSRGRRRIANLGRLFDGFGLRLVAIGTAAVVVATLSLAPPLLTANMIDEAIPGHKFVLLLDDVLGIVCCACVAAGLTMVQGQLSTFVAQSIVKSLRVAVVAHLFRVPLGFYIRTKGGALMSRACNDVEALSDLLATTLPGAFANIVTVVVTCATMFLIDWRLAALSIPLVVVMVIPVKAIGSKMYAIRTASRESHDRLVAGIQESLSLSGITTIKAYTREEAERGAIEEASAEAMSIEMRLSAAGKSFVACTGALGAIGPALVWLYGGWLAMGARLEVGVLVSFTALITTRLYGPLGTLATTHVQIVGAFAVMDRIFEYLDIPAEGSIALSNEGRGNISSNVRQGPNLSFRTVHFTYDSPPRKGNFALNAVTFDVSRGESVAFVGPSGAGKSTLIHLLMRFFDPQSGSIIVDGRDLRSFDIMEWRRLVAVVPQESYLFHDTVLANLQCGDSRASESEMITAAKMANIHETILALPDGYRTVVGERGFRLSGGERQRLAIARALVKKPRLLLMDEATSALDSVNEAAVQRAIQQGIQGRTSIIVAHRLSTVLACDRVFYLNDGRITESGSPQALLAAGGAFATLYNAQNAAATA